MYDLKGMTVNERPFFMTKHEAFDDAIKQRETKKTERQCRQTLTRSQIQNLLSR